MLPPKFRFIWPSGFSGQNLYRNKPTRNKNYLWQPCLLTDGDEMSNLIRDLPSMLPTKCRLILAKPFQRRFFLEIEVRNKNCLWQLCLLTDRDETSNINRVPSRAASYQVSVPLAKCFQRRRFHKQRLSRACIVHLVIKRTNWSYGHLGIPINTTNTKFVKDLPMIDAQFRFNQWNSFREEHVCIFPIWFCVNTMTCGSNVKLSPAVAAILNFISEQKT